MERMTNVDKEYMQKALDLADKGRGWTAPNPLVGAVLVKEGRIIGEGFHEHCGGPHAEVHAVSSASEEIEGSTLYVNLEPCSHTGKTSPCADLLIEKKVKKVVVGMPDPNPLVAGRGIEKLRRAGIEVVTGVLEKESQKLNEIFSAYILSQQPFVVLKTAMSLDGKIATATGQSQWISGEASRKQVHQLRHELSGIMVGIGTVLADDPKLTARLPKSRQPVRIIVDSHLRIPLAAQVLMDQEEARTLIATTEAADQAKKEQLVEMGIEVLTTQSRKGRVDLRDLMKILGQKDIDSILLEGGAELNFSALQAGIVDKVQSYLAPIIIGGKEAKGPVEGPGIEQLREAFQVKEITSRSVGEDLLIEGYIHQEVD